MSFLGGRIRRLRFKHEEKMVYCLVRADIWQSDAAVIRQPAALAGKILVGTWQRLDNIYDNLASAKKHAFSRQDRRYMLLDNIWAAHRQANYILIGIGKNKFQGERKVLRELRRLTRVYHNRTANLSKENVAAIFSDYQKDIDRVRKELINSKALLKQDALQKWESIAGGQDILGRLNKQATGAKLWKAGDDLSARLADLRAVYSKAVVHAATFAGQIDLVVELLWAVENWAKIILLDVQNLRSEGIHTALRTELVWHQQQLREIDFSPYVVSNVYWGELLTTANSLLSNELVLSNIKRLWRLCRIKRIQLIVEEMIGLISYHDAGDAYTQWSAELSRKNQLISRMFRAYRALAYDRNLTRYKRLQLRWDNLSVVLADNKGHRSHAFWQEHKAQLKEFSQKLN
ncbi:MAG: hypothetical protein ACKKL5_02595 [Candidatus Komeilibacteria bacterium]